MAMNNQDDLIALGEAKEIVIDLIDDSAEHLSAVVLHHLKSGREQALATMPESLMSKVGKAGGALLLGGYFHQNRRILTALLGSLFVIILLFVLIANQERGDADLLASDLPPEAYIDGDFDQWLSGSN
jgi:hypothetical protein